MVSLLLLIFLFSEVEFSGYKWRIFENYDPGSKNQFTSGMISLEDGKLVLRCQAVRDKDSMTLYSSGLISKNSFKYGTFIFDVEGKLSELKYACFAPFLYDFATGSIEVDIEYSRWGNPLNPVGNFGVIRVYGVWSKPDSKRVIQEKFDIKPLSRKAVTRHKIKWFPDSLILESYLVKKGREHLLRRWKVTDKRFIPDKPMFAEIYLWWPKNPGRNLEHKIKVLRFQYIPYRYVK